MPDECEYERNYDLTNRNDAFARELAKHILLTFDQNGQSVEAIGGDILDSKVLR